MFKVKALFSPHVECIARTTIRSFKKNQIDHCFLSTGILSSLVVGAVPGNFKSASASKYGAVRFISSHDDFIPQYSIADTVS